MEPTLDQVPRWTRLSPLVLEERPLLEALSGRLRRGDAPVLERVLTELAPLVAGWVRRLLGPRADAEDATQESLTEIAVALHRFEGRSSIQTLAHRIATRTAARFYRRGARPHEGDVDALAADDGDPERAARVRQQAARLYQHLEQMSEVRRTAFVLCCVEELSPAEAAEIVQCTPVTMRSRLFEARAELVERLARDERPRRPR